MTQYADFYKDVDIYVDADINTDIDVDVDLHKDVDVNVYKNIDADASGIYGNFAEFIVEAESLDQYVDVDASATTTDYSSNTNVSVSDGYYNTMNFDANAYGDNTFTEIDAIVLVTDDLTMVSASGEAVTN